MRLTRFAVLCSSLALLGACKDPAGDDVILAPNPPLAYTRFVNGVADTGSTDWRFIDQLEYSPTEFGMRFRDFSPYAGTAPGTRTLRIFPTSTNIDITKNHIIEATIGPLEAGKYYTIIHTGYADASRTPADEVVVIEDAIPGTGSVAAVPAGNIGLRYLHFGTGLGAQDAHAVATATTAISAATAMFTGVAFKGGGATYNTTRPVGTVAFRSANAGGTTTIQASALSPAGSAAQPTNNLTAVGGHTIEQSVLTGILFPASVAGTSARSFTTPGIVWIVDRHPNTF